MFFELREGRQAGSRQVAGKCRGEKGRKSLALFSLNS